MMIWLGGGISSRVVKNITVLLQSVIQSTPEQYLLVTEAHKSYYCPC